MGQGREEGRREEIDGGRSGGEGIGRGRTEGERGYIGGGRSRGEGTGEGGDKEMWRYRLCSVRMQVNISFFFLAVSGGTGRSLLHAPPTVSSVSHPSQSFASL